MGNGEIRTVLRGALCALSALAVMPSGALAAAITVNTSDDEAGTDLAECSLREAVQVADVNAGFGGCARAGTGNDDTILFANANVDPATSIVPAGDPDDNASGDIDVEANPATDGTLTIQGLGQSSTTIEGGVGAAVGDDRLIDHETGTLTLQDLTLKEGDTDGSEVGAGIRAALAPVPADVLNLTNVTLTANDAAGDGGGLHQNNGTLNVTGSTITGNHATGVDADGGGMFVIGANFTLANSTVSMNDTGVAADASNGGGLWFGSALPGTVSGSTISGNTANGGFGGGVHPNSGTLDITGTSISGNHARVGGGIGGLGNFNFNGSQITGNFAETTAAVPSAAGGGVHNLGNSTITNSTVSSNSVVETVAGATSMSGAGISNGNNDIRVVGSTISGNFFNGSPHFGAAMTSAGGVGSDLDLINSTVSGNVESDNFSTIQGFGGGAIAADIIHSTIAGNTFSAAGHSLDFGGAGSMVTLRGSLLADPNACGAGFSAATATYNVEVGSSCPAGTGSASNSNPLLGPLGSNGGPTQTHAVMTGSPALDRVPASACTSDTGAPLGTDQRGSERPSPPGGSCDSGAFELLVAPPVANECAGRAATQAGTDGPDEIAGTNGPDVIAALGGNDIVRGLAGNDLICGGDGRDRLTGGSGKDTLRGERGKDKLKGGGGKDKCIGGPAKDKPPAGCEKARSI